MTTGLVSYGYDADQLLLWKYDMYGPTYDLLYWRDVDGNVLEEWNHSAQELREYIYFNGRRIARRDPGPPERVYYFFQDHLGTARVMTDSSGFVKQESTYYPFGGEQRVISNLVDNDYRFAGMERQPETGWDYTFARRYVSTHGRWSSPDPLGGHIEDPQTLNRYVYVRNNPVNLTDPKGLDFYLRCTQTKENTETCQGGYVGTTSTEASGKRSFARTVVTGDSLRDPNSGNTGTVSEEGVLITTAQGTFQGEYFNNPASIVNGVDRNPADLTGSAMLTDFQFHIDDNCKGTCLASGTFKYGGTPDQTRALLDKRGGFRSVWDREIPLWGKSLDEWIYHEGTTQHRFGSGPSPHFSVPREPQATVSTVGPFHVDKDAPGITHGGCALFGIGCN